MTVTLINLLAFRVITSILLVSFLMTAVMPSQGYTQVLNLPAPGTMVLPSPACRPVTMKGLKIHPENPFLFDFILDAGKSGLAINSPEFKAQSQKLIQYFLAALTIKEADLWVNLSPFEKDRMTSRDLGQTTLGRDMLAQDYLLKQLISSLINPEQSLGKAFWDNVYMKAREQFGTIDIPVDTFNKVWIMADKARVLEHNNGAYVTAAHLKVMLEEDYVALGHQNAIGVPDRKIGKSHSLASQVVRDIIIPEIEKEVNTGETFAPLRQLLYSMILATWYKEALKSAFLNQVYSNKAKLGGVLSDDPGEKEKIYSQYLQAYRKGVFDYIMDEVDAETHQVLPRKYFSGGIPGDFAMHLDHVQQPTPLDLAAVQPNFVDVNVVLMKSDDRSSSDDKTREKRDEVDKAQSKKISFVGDNVGDRGLQNILAWELVGASLGMIPMFFFVQILLTMTVGVGMKQQELYVAGKSIGRIRDKVVHSPYMNYFGTFDITSYLLEDGDVYHLITFSKKVRFFREDKLYSRRRINPASEIILNQIHGLLSTVDSFEARDSAAAANAKMVNGGIDLSDQKMGLDVVSDGDTRVLPPTPAMIEEFHQGKFLGLEGIILRIIPAANPLQLLGF